MQGQPCSQAMQRITITIFHGRLCWHAACFKNFVQGACGIPIGCRLRCHAGHGAGTGLREIPTEVLSSGFISCLYLLLSLIHPCPGQSHVMQ
jgi:hypothetical protein